MFRAIGAGVIPPGIRERGRERVCRAREERTKLGRARDMERKGSGGSREQEEQPVRTRQRSFWGALQDWGQGPTGCLVPSIAHGVKPRFGTEIDDEVCFLHLQSS